MTDLLPKNADYLNPVHQGWLIKEGLQNHVHL